MENESLVSEFGDSMVYGSYWALINSMPHAFDQVTSIYGKSRTTDEAHQANRASFLFFQIGRARVGSRAPTYKVKT